MIDIGTHLKAYSMKKNKLPLSLRFVRGAIGKRFVVKHYAYGIVKTRFPDMKSIVPTVGQQQCRRLFKEAAFFAKSVLQDPIQKRHWQNKLKVTRRLFNRLVQHFMLREKVKKCKASMMTERLLIRCFKTSSRDGQCRIDAGDKVIFGTVVKAGLPFTSIPYLTAEHATRIDQPPELFSAAFREYITCCARHRG